MNIGQVVKELKKVYPSASISRVRFLEKEGLIKPKRSKGGTRIFTNKDLKKLNYCMKKTFTYLELNLCI